jgi:transposase-like protein
MMMADAETLSLYEFFQRFPNEEAARKFFEGKRWPNGVDCPHCGSVSVAECKDHRPMAYRCRDCRQHFSVRTGGVLAESRLPLQKWLMAIYMMTTARKGIPSTQVARELGITQKSAWFLCQRIRETWLAKSAGVGSSDTGPLSGEVEADETYIGGKKKNQHANKRVAGRGTAGKTPVAGVMQRGERVIAQRVIGTSTDTLQGFVRGNVAAGATLYTDEHASYVGMPEYKHHAVKHTAKQYVDGMAHTNGIESFWALLKRGHYVIFHYMSVKHLDRYVGEFANRHNTAGLSTLAFMGDTATGMVGRHISYKELTHG